MRKSNQVRVGRRRAVRLLALAAVALLAFSGGWLVGRRTARPRREVRVVYRQAKAKPKAKKAAQPAVPRAIDAAMQKDLVAKLTQQHFSGVAIMVKNGRLVAEYAAGMANAAKGQANTPDTMFEIDSLQKSLTAGLVMRLVAQGRLSLSTPIGQFYPRFANQPALTVDRLLHMASGLSTPATLVPVYQNDAQLVAYDVAHLTANPKHLGQYQYTPINYVLLAGICAQITGQSYQDLFTATYIKGLGLQHTAFAYDLPAGQAVATGYQMRGNQPYGTAYAPSLSQLHAELGTGQVYMSALDLYRAGSALMSGKLLSAASRAVLYQRGQTYGGGFYLNEPGAFRANGSGYGFMSTIQLNEDGRAGVVIIGNVQGAGRVAINALGAQLRQQYLTGK